MLANGTVAEVIKQAGLTTWSVSGKHLYELAEKLRGKPGVDQTVAFGNMLHVSGKDAGALEKAITPFRTGGNEWHRTESGLEDVFIQLLDESNENAKKNPRS